MAFLPAQWLEELSHRLLHEMERRMNRNPGNISTRLASQLQPTPEKQQIKTIQSTLQPNASLAPESPIQSDVEPMTPVPEIEKLFLLSRNAMTKS